MNMEKLTQERKNLIMSAISHLCRDCHRTALGHGWWVDFPDMGDGTGEQAELWLMSKLLLIVSEIGELTESIRDGTWMDEDGQCPTVEHAAVELADVLIRIFDLCGKFEINLAEGLLAKMAYNETRPYRHGGKRH